MAKRPKAEGVVYPGMRINGHVAAVERLRPQNVDRHIAKAIQTLMQAAYTAQFETPNGPLPEDRVAQYMFSPNSKAHVKSQLGQMRQHMEQRDSAYWILRNREQRDELLGISRITPNRNGAFFNSVVVHPDQQRQGAGTLLAHVALSHLDDTNGSLGLRGYVDSPVVNTWFEEKWGMVARGVDEQGTRVGPWHRLPQIEYATPEGLTIADVLERLEEHTPQLMSARAVSYY